MHATLSTVLAPLDREAVARELDELREQLEDCEALLRLIDRHQRDAQSRPSPAPAADAQSSEHSGKPTRNGHARAPLTRKRDTVLAILREKPGRWANRDMRAALAERGIDPQAGTPVKNIMWKLAKDGIVHASGNGVYEFPPLNVREHGDPQEVLAA